MRTVEVELTDKPVEMRVEYRRKGDRGHCLLSWEPGPAGVTTGWPLTGHYLFPDRDRAADALVPPLVAPVAVKEQKRLSWTKPPERGASVAVTPDGTQVLAAGHHPGELAFWQLADSKSLWQGTSDTRALRKVDILPDGKSAVLVPWRSSPRVFDIARGNRPRSFVGHREACNAAAVSPDGRRCVSCDGSDKTVRIWDTTTCAELSVTTTDGKAYSVAWTVDGQRVLISSMNDPSLLAWSGDAKSKPVSFASPIPLFGTVAVSPAGRWVGVPMEERGYSGLFVLFDLEAGKAGRMVRAAVGEGQFLAFTPNGRSYVTAGTGPTRLWDTETGAELARFGDDTDVTFSAAFTPDGRHLLTVGRLPTADVRVWPVPSRLAK